MQHIQVLDQITIDKIAAGEVIERPASVVKELVENAIDAGASSIGIEIEEGGISLIRITDNGSGISKEDIRNAFLRHSTSKIHTIDDLQHISSLGFRGEALSSIAAVTKVELITKQKEDTYGSRYLIEGGKEVSFEDTGASDGTVFTIRQLFYNVPARRKFLKTAITEAGHIQDLLIRLALSHPEVSFRFLNNGQEKLRTSGSGKLNEVIYSIYGREVASNLLEVNFETSCIHLTGYLGKPVITRGNRNFETFFVNGRYVKSAMISKSVEDAYKDFMMQHKFPFVVLHFSVPQDTIDINVHPTKMELRFQRQQDIYNSVYEGVHRRLLEPELIPHVEAPKPVEPVTKAEDLPPASPQKAEYNPEKAERTLQNTGEKTERSPFLLRSKNEPHDEEYFLRKMKERVTAYHNRSSSAEVSSTDHLFRPQVQKERIAEVVHESSVQYNKPEQLDLFEENLLKRETRAEYTLIGQVFDTYWLVQFHDNLYIIDQHAAHERVLYERTLKEMKNREFTSQYLSPPIILTLTMQEEQILKEHMDRFEKIGFEIEPFGGDEYAVRAVPDNLFSIAKKELLLEMLDNLADGLNTTLTPDLIDEKIASMSCKAAVKGNNRLSAKEVDTLIGELLTLENPYHCPHGRPTIIAMSKRELEKKFKRIV